MEVRLDDLLKIVVPIGTLLAWAIRAESKTNEIERRVVRLERQVDEIDKTIFDSLIQIREAIARLEAKLEDVRNWEGSSRDSTNDRRRMGDS